jgi:hypothetical protein
MNATLLALVLGAVLSADSDKPRPPNPLAPSLPLLTDEEEEKLDEVINRLIDAEMGKLAGEAHKKAFDDFRRLGPEAIPALIRGLNRAAKIETSCPAVIIARKLERMLAVTEDRELLEFARENIGAGVGRTRHHGVLQTLRVGCMVRKAVLARLGGTGTTPTPRTTRIGKSPRTMSVAELAKAAETERGPRLKAVLTELGSRRGDDALSALGRVAGSSEEEARTTARDLLRKSLSEQSEAVLRQKLKDELPALRAAAAQVAGEKKLRVVEELIGLLDDPDESVSDAARIALVRVSDGQDFGPRSLATKEERQQAIKKWREWWASQPKP